jgi:ATP-binding protein involved in chromosome partitioning
MTDLSALTELANSISGGKTGGVRLTDGRLVLALDATGLPQSARDAITERLKRELGEQPGISEVRVAITAARQGRILIAVGSGKGGVGKSTLATNLAIALAAQGRRVGLVDADIYGPSQPRLLNCEGMRPIAEGEKLVPVMSAYGIPLLSMGQLVEPGKAVAWRGPMAGRALEQLIDAHWRDAEVLIIDLPPGTGDIQLSMLQKFRPAGAVIVSTPQDLALMDATRAINLFQDAGVPIIGLVENMAGYVCPHCQEISDPFGDGGAERAAKELGLPFLARVPLTRAIRLASDAGVPPATRQDGDGAIFHQLAQQVGHWLEAAHAPPSSTSVAA